MDKIRRLVFQIGVEIPLCIYTITSFFKTPVYQNLVYEKLCLENLNDSFFCSNITNYHEDKDLQTQYAYFYWLSTFIYIIPSLITTLLLGVASDYWNAKVSLLIPFLGLVLNTMNCITQSVYISNSHYFLLIGDVCFGLCGGYISVISTGMTYGVKTTHRSNRSYRIAGMDGALGLGGTLGFALSGTIRQAFGYAYAFSLLLFLQSLAILYIIFMEKEIVDERTTSRIVEAVHEDEQNISASPPPVHQKLSLIFTGFSRMLSTSRPTRTLIWLSLFGLGVEFFLFLGLGEIQYSYLRYKFAWGDVEFGWFSGISFGLSTMAMFLLYPYLRFRGLSDAQLSCLGTVTKIISLILMAFLFNKKMIYSVLVASMFNRFIAAGFRSFLSTLIENDEQGMMFSLTGLLEGVTTLLSAAIYSGLYPLTLSFFPGLLYLVSGILLCPSVAILSYSDWKMKKIQGEESNYEPVHAGEPEEERN